MIVYHGSICEIVKPDIKHSKRYLDFGCGFYVTTYKNQAERWAIRAARICSRYTDKIENAVVNSTNVVAE